MNGICVKYDRVGRWGFITPSDVTLPDHFVHASAITGPKSQHFLCVGQKVEFDSTGLDTEHPTALNVRKFPFTIAFQRSAPPPGPGKSKS
jgi:cold shock CspA family protein